jgi:hypothetical protein
MHLPVGDGCVPGRQRQWPLTMNLSLGQGCGGGMLGGMLQSSQPFFSGPHLYSFSLDPTSSCPSSQQSKAVDSLPVSFLPRGQQATHFLQSDSKKENCLLLSQHLKCVLKSGPEEALRGISLASRGTIWSLSN